MRCSHLTAQKIPGTYQGHILPGSLFLVIGILHLLEIGIKSYTINRHPHPQSSIPMSSLPGALCLIVAPIIGIWAEQHGTFWSTSEVECFRNYARNGTATVDTKNPTDLAKCAFYPLQGTINKWGHSEHMALYFTFAMPAVLNLFSRAVHKYIPPLSSSTALLERFMYVCTFFVQYIMWSHHASAMDVDPCWNQNTKHVMALNMLWHMLLAYVNLMLAGFAGFSIVQPKKWEPIIFVWIGLIWQGSMFVLIAVTNYAGGHNESRGRWLPDPTLFLRHPAVCVEAAQSCGLASTYIAEVNGRLHLIPTYDISIEDLKGHGVALFAFLSGCSMLVGVLCMALGWCAMACYTTKIKGKLFRYEMVQEMVPVPAGTLEGEGERKNEKGQQSGFEI